MTDPTATRITRAERLAMPLAREVVQDQAAQDWVDAMRHVARGGVDPVAATMTWLSTATR